LTLPTFGSLVGGHVVSSTVSVQVTLYAGQGGQVSSYTGGLGGKSAGTISSSTAPVGTTLYYIVGQAGGNPYGSGCSGGGGALPGLPGYADGGGAGCYASSAGTGGGGSSWINISNNSSTALLSAGGGGGGGTTATNAGSGGGGNAGGSCTGGSPGSNANGGGGRGCVAAGVTSVTTSTGLNSGNGTLTIVYTFNYNDPTENVSSTVSGNNFGGTVTVSAATAHLSPTTSTINFAPWTIAPTGVSCMANTWASSLAPFILAENTTSVEFGFGSTIAGNKYDYQCNAY
jgi:hypothetical protein